MASPVEASLESALEYGAGAALESALDPSLVWADEGLSLEEFGDVRRDEVPGEVDRRLAALCRERGPLRAVLARIAARLVSLRAWERIGYARLSDYAVERLGLSARSVRGLAQVGARLDALPRLEDALVSGTLGWTKVRLLARLPPGEDEAAWIAHARRVTAEELSREVRAVDRGSVEAGAADEEGARSCLFEVCCRPEVRWKWHVARGAAARVAGHMLHVSEAAELIAAEVLSALPIDEHADEDAREEAGTSWSQESEPAADTAGSELSEAGSESAGAAPAEPAVRPPWRAPGAEPAHPSPLPARPSFPPAPKPLHERLEDADAFEVDERFRCALSMEQRLEARIGPLLALVWERWVHRALGYATREAYARERLGMDPTRARALVRLERAAVSSEAFARTYRCGVLSWVKANVLAPLVSADPLGWFVEDWVAWAGRVTVRRLREDVEQALALSETDPEAFRQRGGLPPEASDDREIRAAQSDAGEDVVGRDREIGAARMEREGHLEDADEKASRGIGATEMGTGEHAAGQDREIGATRMERERHLEEARPGAATDTSGAKGEVRGDREIGAGRRDRKGHPAESCSVRFFGPADVVQLFRALLCTVRRRMEPDRGRLPTSGEALGAMLDHVLSAWGALDDKVAARHKVFARDGWRCSAPGCTSMQNLHDHHIRFRSVGGPDTAENRITLCAFHHLRGVHAGLLKCVGRAPDGLRWEMGIRPGVTPLLAYRSGDLRVAATAPS